MKRKKEIKEIERFYPNYQTGLTFSQVNKRKEEGLVNKVKDQTKKQYFDIVVRNVFTFYNVLLFAIGGFLLAANEFLNCFFLIVVIANTVIGLVQDLRAKIKLDQLSLINESKIETVRNGETIKISVDSIVLDEILHLKSGDQVPCDADILSGEVEVDEANLTGESLPLNKIAGKKLLSGSYILSGEVFVKVNAVGKNNYAYKIQAKTKDYKTPRSSMYLQLNRLFKIITLIVLSLGAATAISKGFRDEAFSSWELFLRNFAPIAGSLISMIPSGMYLLISTTLTVGVIDLSSKKVLVQDMYSIETLARVDTLCIDKTGTITDGTMSVYDTILFDSSPFSKAKFDAIMSSFNFAINETNYTALGLERYFNKKEIFAKVLSIPFNSHNKYSSATLSEIGTITVGAYGFVPLKNNEEIKQAVDEYSSRGYRVLVVGFSKDTIKERKSPNDLTAVGLILLQDCIRENAKNIIEWFIKNNVDIKIISGDNELTVKEIASLVGVKNTDKYISLAGLSDEEVKKAALEYNIFGRVSPEQKELIVETLKYNDHVVSMFGDGINDLLALKASNVGITIGAASKAAKDIANIILYTNDFASIPNVISQGRRIINNLQRICSLFLIKTVFAILINVYFLITSMTIGATFPFLPQHFYGWDVVCIGIAGFFLALEKNNNEIVKGGFLRNIFRAAMFNGVLIAICVVLLSLYGHQNGYSERENVTVAVYFMAITSFVSLFEVCFPLDWYRWIVFVGSIIATGAMFVFTYISGFNILGIDLKLHFTDIAYQICITLAIFIVVSLIYYQLPALIRYIKKRKGLKND